MGALFDQKPFFYKNFSPDDELKLKLVETIKKK